MARETCAKTKSNGRRNGLNTEQFDLFQKVSSRHPLYHCGMIINNKIIEFKAMPLFQKARFKTPMDMQGSFQDLACFFYLVEGNMLSFDPRGRHRLGENEAMIKNCGQYIQRYVPNSGAEECEAIAIYLYPDLLRTIYRNEVPSFLQQDQQLPPKRLIGNKLIQQYMSNLTLFFEEPEALDEELSILKLKELMVILLRSEGHEDVRKLLSEIFTPVNIAFKETIEKNLYNPLSLEQLAFICNMSLSTFKREFKRAFNDSPARYIKNKRLEHAATLLACKNESITSIAFDAGFQDLTTFSDSFHKRFNLSPRQYRLAQIRK